MTTDRCAHGLPMATWCDDCAADFTLRTGPDPVAWTWTPRRRRRWPLALLAACLLAALAWRIAR